MQLTVKRETSPISTTWAMTTIPCSPHMLAELADGLIHGGKTLAVNHWEGRETLWNRASFLKMRNFMQANHFASSTGGGQMALTPLGSEFLREYLTRGALPHSLAWHENTTARPATMSHDHEAHTHEEDYEPLPA